MFPVTPCPLHEPPAVPVNNVVRLIVPVDSQMAPGEVHAGLTFGVTVILNVCTSEHGVTPTLYVIAIGPLRPVGLNEVPLTPVPLQLPPGLPVTNAVRFTFPAASQIVPGVVHAAETAVVTEILCVEISAQGEFPTV